VSSNVEFPVLVWPTIRVSAPRVGIKHHERELD
jgi:hypothetical protein